MFESEELGVGHFARPVPGEHPDKRLTQRHLRHPNEKAPPARGQRGFVDQRTLGESHARSNSPGCQRWIDLVAINNARANVSGGRHAGAERAHVSGAGERCLKSFSPFAVRWQPTPHPPPSFTRPRFRASVSSTHHRSTKASLSTTTPPWRWRSRSMATTSSETGEAIPTGQTIAATCSLKGPRRHPGKRPQPANTEQEVGLRDRTADAPSHASAFT